MNENLTQEEREFFERMQDAPEEQRSSFRSALNALMKCYGERPTCAVLATFIDKSTGDMQTTGINLVPNEMLLVAAGALQVIQQNAAPREDETGQ